MGPKPHATHTIHSHHVHHGWDNSLAPVLEVEPGDVVELEVLDASGGQLTRRSTAADVAVLDFSRINPVTGPVFVQGAEPGDVLAVEILDLRPSDWGWTALIPGFGLLADAYPDPVVRIWEYGPDDDEAVFSDEIRIPIRPFPGTIGVAPGDAGHHSIVPPYSSGGNMDIRHLTAGSVLYLPVKAPGALFSIGDTHAAQGDGEVCGTAIESPMTVTLRLSLRRDMNIRQPQYRLPGPVDSVRSAEGFHVTTGIADDVMEASKSAVRAMVAHLVEVRGLAEVDAYMLASVTVDLRISELVNAPNWVVSAFLPQSIFRS
jgi:acetamidase/formamidase